MGEQLKQARLEFREAEQTRDALKREITQRTTAGCRAGAGPEPPCSVAVPEIDGRIDALKRNLDALLRSYTEQHPDVVSTQAPDHSELEEQKRREIVAARGRPR